MTQNQEKVKLSQIISDKLETSTYLREVYERVLRAYSADLFFNLCDTTYNTDDVFDDALQFADLLSKSSGINAEKHKMLAQGMLAVLQKLYPDNVELQYYLGTVLVNNGNFYALGNTLPNHRMSQLLERLYVEFIKELTRVPADDNLQFLRSQKVVYDRMSEQYLSYTGPTSMGKSFIMRMFIKEQVMNGVKANFALLVPTKALINEVKSEITNDLKELLQQHNYGIVESIGDLILKERENFIFVLTPERLLYLLIANNNINIDYLFVDEAHKISTSDSRSSFYYQVINILTEQSQKPHVFFASPNIPNPEIYLKLIPEIKDADKHKLATTLAPVNQVKYLIDCVAKEISLFNDLSQEFISIGKIDKTQISICGLVETIGDNTQNVVYCSSTGSAVSLAKEYADNRQICNDTELLSLSRDIGNTIHKDYFLADFIRKGVAYHIGYLPPAIRMRIEKLFKSGKIQTIFCTSTLIEGVNLPAENLFITSYKNGISEMSKVDFKNLIGRVGRTKYNLFGNVFLVRMEQKVNRDKFEKLITEKVPDQTLFVISELTENQKKKIVETLLEGNIELLRYPKKQSNEEYLLMRKFTLILLRDISKGRNSIVRKAFEPYLKDGKESLVIAAFNKYPNVQDDDINISVDQTNNLIEAIAKHNLKYPAIGENNFVDGNELFNFLENLCKIFKWEKYEPKTLGYVGKTSGGHGRLRWYAVILSQWIKGDGLQAIMHKAIDYRKKHTFPFYINDYSPAVIYIDSLEHRNIEMSKALDAIEHIVLFSISSYFLKFSEAYKKHYNIIGRMANDWYEFVEYGTTNQMSIMLQQYGFSTETATYILKNQNQYIRTVDGLPRLLKTIEQCDNINVINEVRDIKFNVPELFID